MVIEFIQTIGKSRKGGYRVVPERIEFWQGGAHRLHDRFLYSRDGESWRIEQLQP